MEADVQCTTDNRIVDVLYQRNGADIASAYIWMEGERAVTRTAESWADLVESRGYTIRVKLVPVSADTQEACASPERVVLADLLKPNGARVQGIACDPVEWPGGPFALALQVQGGPVDKGAALWSGLGVWRWLVLAAAAVLAVVAWKGDR